MAVCSSSPETYQPHAIRPTKQIADGCFVCTIDCVFTAFPVLTKTTGFSEQGNTGEILALQCQVHSLVNLFGLLFMAICDASALSFFALKKHTHKVKWHSGCIRNINCET